MVNRATLVAGMSLLGAGCSFFSSESDRFNVAFPPRAEVRVAEETLRTYLQSDHKALASFEEQYGERLRLRAMTCSLGLSIGAFDSANAIRKMPVQQSCLQSEDAKLIEYLGIRQVAARLSKPPLRPLMPIGPPAIVSGGTAPYSAVGASGAGVAIIRGGSGEFVSVAIPGGEKIADLPRNSYGGPNILISPNGRVAAFPRREDGTLFVDMESGEKLWAAPELGDVLVFNPELQIALANARNGNELQLVDFASGTRDADPLGLKQQTWGLNLSSKPARLLTGSARVISVLEGERKATGVELRAVKTHALSVSQGVTSTWPTLMNNGKTLLFVSSRDYAIVDLDTGEERFIETDGLIRNQYAKYSETEILVDTYGLNGLRTQPWLFDVMNLTLAPVLTEAGKSGILIPLAGRTGFARRESQIWFGDRLEVGDPVPLEKERRSRNLEKQLAELAAMEAGASVERQPGSFAARGLATPRSVSSPTYLSGTSASKFAFPVRMTLSSKTTVQAVGVYEPGGQTSAARSANTPWPIDVYVKPGSAPVVLVLSSHEAVRWQIHVEAGAKLEGVLYSGYEESIVAGAGHVPVLRIGSVVAYEMKEPRYVELDRLQARFTGRSISRFQGLYRAMTFVVTGE